MGLIVLLVATACRVDTTVDIRVDDDGSGRVAYTVVANADAVRLLVDDPTDLRFGVPLTRRVAGSARRVDRGGCRLLERRP